METFIDMSHYQNVTSWDDLAKAVKRICHKCTEGTDNNDPFFQVRAAIAKAKGIEWWAYCYFHPEQDGYAQAKHALDKIGIHTKTVMVDLESFERNGTDVWSTVNPENIEARLKTFIDVLVKNGMEIIIYADKDLIDRYLPNASWLGKFKIWGARYASEPPAVPKFWNALDFWQFTAMAKVSGIEGNVDMNYVMEPGNRSPAPAENQKEAVMLGDAGTKAPTPTAPAPSAPAPAKVPMSQTMVPGTNIPVDAAIVYTASVITEIVNANVITDPKIQTYLHLGAVFLLALAHGLHTDGN